LWPWVREAISRLRPRYAILENVRGHLSLGGATVLGELASIGYDAEWRVISAASVGANHRRDRIIIVAYPNDTGPHSASVNAADTGEQAQRGVGGCSTNVAYPANGIGRCPEPHGVQTVYGQTTELGKQGWHSRSISDWWQVEPDVGRVADGVPHRVDRLRGLGNAVVPQVAEVIGRLVVEHAAHN
jgi:DNA (cytosine-5)-methyltransferase 1